MYFLWRVVAVTLAASRSVVTAQNTSNASLPIVDLGYNIQQASSYDSTGETYTFSNIRFAQAPVGKLRFSKPLPPLTNRSIVHNGSDGQDCPSAYPTWLGAAYPFINQYLSGQLGPVKAKRQALGGSGGGGMGEDCLFLDVVAPKEAIECEGNGTGVPVLVWIFGGGYTLGSKSAYGSPAGLLAQAKEIDDKGVIVSARQQPLDPCA